MAGKLLFAVLDWGLGHATRSIPVIDVLLNAGYEVHLAGNGPSSDILKNHFSKLPFWDLPGYEPRYSRANLLPFAIVSQIPGFLKTINLEHEKLRQLQTRMNYDLVVSDNRYGCFLNDRPSVLICHQLQIPLRGWPTLFAPVLQSWHRSKFSPFSELWVPDQQDLRLSGKMSEYDGEIPVEFIGLPTRLDPCRNSVKGDYILAVLSGPEPQRSVFENRLIEEMSKMKALNFILIRGIAGHLNVPSNIRVVPFAHKDEMQKLMCEARWAVCRSGYSSLIDLLQLKKKAIVVPTPGMPEQEYLAKQVSALKMFDVADQSGIRFSPDFEPKSIWEGNSPELNKEKILSRVKALINPQ